VTLRERGTVGPQGHRRVIAERLAEPVTIQKSRRIVTLMNRELEFYTDRRGWPGFEADRCNVALGLLDLGDDRVLVGGRAHTLQGRHATRRYLGNGRSANASN
jgi:hypothetical protein